MTRSMLPLLVPALLVITGLVAAGCTGSVAAPGAAGDIRKFSSADEIRAYIENNTAIAAGEDGYWYGGSWVVTDSIRTMVPTAVPRTAAESSGAKGLTLPAVSGGSADHSTTNVQVAGVDEPDFVKNDGRYIYVISGQTLAIVDAYPASSAAIVSKTVIENAPQNLFVSGDRLVLFVTGTAESGEPSYGSGAASGVAGNAIRYDYYRPASPVTHAIFYDISDRAHPKVLKDYTIDGDYIDARLIGSDLYLITRDQIYTYVLDELAVPAVREGTRTIVAPDVYYFDNPEYQYAFTTITSFDTGSAGERDARTYLVGSGNILYVSGNAIYITCQKYHNVYYPPRPVPLVPVVYNDAVSGEESVSSGAAAGSSTGGAVPVLSADFNRMSEADQQAYILKLKGAEQQAASTQEIDQTTTAIHKIAISNGAISYVARGDVSGALKDQFAMDEYTGNLRVATTSSVYTTRGSYEYNNVFVLDSGMKLIGSLTHIAEQEQIYATRFIGDRLYMVTYKRVDPFFVIDLSDPAKPKILGKLKIPGFSDYLHPYDATHIIGVGKETATNDWGGVSTRGLKLAFFDVSDVNNPKQIDTVEIGDAGSDSAALTDHRAFLFDRDRNLLVIPARVVKSGAEVTDKSGTTLPNIWYGAYVFGLTPETGFTLRGTIGHGTDNSTYYWYGSSQNEVKRSLYIGNVLYTISANKILANSLSDINTTIATIGLPGTGDVLYPVEMIRETG